MIVSDERCFADQSVRFLPMRRARAYMRKPNRAWPLGSCLFAAGLAVLLAQLFPLYPQNPPEAKAPAYPNSAPGVNYVGSAACAGCHQEIHDDYRRGAMGRSMHPGDAAFQQQFLADRVTVRSEKLGRDFEVFRDGDDLFQSEYALGSDGKPVFKATHKLDYVIGSGVNGYTYVVRRGDHLFQAPLSYYSRTKKWDLSPGYEFADYGFSRPIHAGCVACHAGRPQPVADREGLYRDPPFEELAIGCENCHGPGQLHVEQRLLTLESSAETDTSIVNPAKLPARLGEDVCMNCHQGGDTRVLQPGKDHTDFRPGTHLNDTVAILKLPMRRNDPRESDLLEHHFMMKLSKCFRGTEGRLSCFSCHEIHNQPSPERKVSYYRQKCLSCHSDLSCLISIETRLGQRPPNDCAGCHMPKRDINVISHSSLTNHRIIVSKDQPYPAVAYRQTTADLPELVHVNRPEGAGAESLPLLTRFRAFGELLLKWPQFQEKYVSVLAQAAEQHPNDPLVLAALGRKAKLEAAGRADPQALEYLQMAVEAGSTTPATFEDLADMLSLAGREPEAADVLKQGVELAPYNARLLKRLTLVYINLKRYAEAQAMMQSYVERFPEDDFMRGLLAKVQGSPAP